MLSLDKPIGPIQGLMIYQDHEDTGLFYYVPERPRLARNDGVPEFVFLKYRRDITDNPDFDPETKQALGGGFLAFTVDLGVDEDLLQEARNELEEHAEGREVRLTPVQFRKGSVRLSISKDAADADDAAADQPRGLSFVEEVLGPGKPSLFGFNRAHFGVVLGQEAATLFEDALRSGLSPIGVIYDLEFLGLRPAFNVRVTAEYNRIYNHLETEFGARGQIQAVSLGLDIAAAFQKLRDDGAIKVEVLNFTDDADLRKKADDAFEWIKKDLLKDFFKSALEPPGFMRQRAGQGLLGQLQGLFGALNTSQGNATARPQLGGPTSAQGTSAQRPTSTNSGVRSTSQQNRTAAQAGSASSTGRDNNLSPFQVAFSLKFMRQEERKTRHFEYSMRAAVAREAAPQGMFSTLIEGLDLSRSIREISLDDDFLKRLVSTVSMGGDLAAAGINTVAVNLEYPAALDAGEQPEHVDGFLFRPDDLAAKTFTTFLNEEKELDYRYRMDIHFSPNSPWQGLQNHVQSGWQTTRARQLTLDPLDEVGLLDIEIALGQLTSGQVQQAQVEVAYEDAGNNLTLEKTFILRPGDEPSHWRLRLADPEVRTYRHRTTYFLEGNLRHTTEWQEEVETTLVVNEPFAGQLNVRLVPLLDANELIEAVLDFTYEEADTGYVRRLQQVFTPDNLRSQVISLPTLAADPETYSYELTVIRLDGSQFSSGPLMKDDRALVISDGAGATHRLTVKLVDTNLAAAGLAAVRVRLVGPGDDPDRDEALFTPSQLADRRMALVQPHEGGAFTYSFEVEGYDLEGRPVPGTSGQSSDRTLIVPLPRN